MQEFLYSQARNIGMEAFNLRSHLGMIRQTARGKAKSVFFSKLIIITALIPIFSFQKVEGKMFSPLAITLGFALLGALIFTLTLVPALSSMLLRKNVIEKKNRFLEAVYSVTDRFFAVCRRNSREVVVIALVAMVAGLGCFSLLGTEFLP